MMIEMINALTYSDAPGVAWQIERVRTGKSDALWLATPHEDAVHLVKIRPPNTRRVINSR